ncbi:hypothetical protein M404DRAFT_1007741 [Pisolithus tinctorius Marx 270]|uniref:Uncharacterized protein n=1 Tax=Pisolithus tinctorius Marx 270 TaxID=870435 RepID=A0A0C3IDK4_PISTI|nr:hypothetical protein M404DRAFT_1007741 [Pisolithus tinctorius Marx 270]
MVAPVRGVMSSEVLSSFPSSSAREKHSTKGKAGVTLHGVSGSDVDDTAFGKGIFRKTFVRGECDMPLTTEITDQL